jgi:MFS transporter, DHA2 family, methylenomycin A resistance protein
VTDDHAATPSDNAAEVENGGQSRRLVLAVMCVGYFLVLLDVTIVNVALPSIGDDLNTSVWRWVFGINAPIVLIAGIVTIRRVENDRNRGERGVDALGTALGHFYSQP